MKALRKLDYLLKSIIGSSPRSRFSCSYAHSSEGMAESRIDQVRKCLPPVQTRNASGDFDFRLDQCLNDNFIE